MHAVDFAPEKKSGGKSLRRTGTCKNCDQEVQLNEVVRGDGRIDLISGQFRCPRVVESPNRLGMLSHKKKTRLSNVFPCVVGHVNCASSVLARERGRIGSECDVRMPRCGHWTSRRVGCDAVCDILCRRDRGAMSTAANMLMHIPQLLCNTHETSSGALLRIKGKLPPAREMC
ncbi:hypothetical protein PoB_006849700 [Plakobranchus ocellatus]|uniref:Uncharacterized protein n=1 Tax=Plakobranchus ocellatus TaxID=259542 RepID=A0AAV4DD94_9GAST|nr:hypothetical protein PoB_006849700 [Plakobranchus ocellatus]